MKLMPPVRSLSGLIGAASIVLGLAGSRPVGHLLAAEAPQLVLNLRLTTSDALPPASRRALITEAESIWTRGHVRLKWLRESTEAEPGPFLPVLVVAHPVPRATEYSPWTVAELVRFEGSKATAIASTIGARRIVDESRWEILLEPSALQDRRLGVVLGRAVSHEIGHYLLQTNTHARQGLMRALIDAREFADLRPGAFRLDDAAEAHLAALAERGTLSTEAVTSFSYPAP